MATFLQAVRETPSQPMPAGEPLTLWRDAYGHRWRIEPHRLVIDHPSGGQVIVGRENGLPVTDLTCLAPAPNGDLWLGSQHGAIRISGRTFEYYAGRRWLPDDRVERLLCDADSAVWVETPAGVGRIAWREMALADKADHYEALTDARHVRYGYVTGCTLERPGDLTSWRHNIDDNDGLWTAMYVAAQSFRYAVTGSDDARDKARRSLYALFELERLTPISGYPARALTHRSEPDFGRPRGGEWHPTPDGEWEWKGDTSSDEIDGHYFAWGIYHDLVADDTERTELAEVVRRVTDHILDHGLYLVDLDGQPTRWGVWAPERLNDDPAWRAERGLNSLEILSYLRVAHHITGEPCYVDAYRELVEQHHYALNTVEQKVLPGDFPDAENNHSDDELAFLSYYGLLRYETDPELRRIYLASLERSWWIEQPEGSALWNVIYGGLTGRPCDVDAAVAYLREVPLDLIEWTVTNSHRLDLALDEELDRGGREQLLIPLSPRERVLHKWNGNPYVIDGGNDRVEECGTFWLLPYWMGRWHGLIHD